MLVRFYFYELISAFGHPPTLRRNAAALQVPEEVAVRFNSYLLTAIGADLLENRYGDVDKVLSAVGEIEKGNIDVFETGGQDFVHHITRSRVCFEHSVFGECPEWPIWCCTLAQYKAALEGYRRFLDMPKSIDSELIIELPEGAPETAP